MNPSLPIFFVASLFASLCLAGDSDDANPTIVNVKSDVWPILQERCLHCHGPSKSDGSLRLDSKASIDAGGHTGNPILGSDHKSELLRRLTSTNDAYRMPKGEFPLSVEQIEILKRWIQQGSSWPDGAMLAEKVDSKTTNDYFSRDYWSQFLDNLVVLNEPLRILYIPFLAFLILITILEHRKSKRASTLQSGNRNAFLDRIQNRIGFPQYAVGILVFLFVASIQHHRVTLQRMTLQIKELESNSGVLFASKNNVTQFQVPKPHRPKHPPQLGGTYYRGNDERSPKLFNGGYYRTATMQVGLFDANKTLLRWGDPIDDNGLFIQLIVSRAAFATSELFQDESMKGVSLARDFPNSGSIETETDDDKSVKLETLIPGESWQATYRIDSPNWKDQGQLSGLLYLGNDVSHPHYGIQYDIHCEDGKIDEKSEIWMGAILLVSNVFDVPEGSIPLNEWFDFLPIPEITNGNTDDPVLLGIKPGKEPVQVKSP